MTLGLGWIEFAGEDGAPVRLPLGMMQRMRSGFDEGKGGPFYQTRLWPAGEPPLLLMPLREDRAAYAQFVRALAPQVAASHGLAAVERGTTVAAALYLPVAIGLLLAATLAVCIFALAEEPTLLRWVPAVIPALLFAFLVWRFQTLHRPRSVADLGELERQLPG